MELLRQLYFISSPSRKEKQMSKFIRGYLKKRKIKFNVLGNQIYRLIPNTPLITAHMDQVGNKQLTFLVMDEGIIGGDANLGADDKNGVWLILKLLKTFNNKVSFIFSDQEEAGGNIREVLNYEKNKKTVKTLKYGLVLDRRDGDDIIGTFNDYCVKELEEDIEELSDENKLGYTREMGLWSDADEISKHMSCINLSVGFHAAHTEWEYTNIRELKNALGFSTLILKNINKKYNKPIPKYSNHIYSRGYRENDAYYDRWVNGGVGIGKDKTHTYQYYDEKGMLHKHYTENTEDVNEILNAIPGISYYCEYCDIIMDESSIHSDWVVTQCPYCYREIQEVSSESYLEDTYYESAWFCDQCDEYYRTSPDDLNDEAICPTCGNFMWEIEGSCDEKLEERDIIEGEILTKEETALLGWDENIPIQKNWDSVKQYEENQRKINLKWDEDMQDVISSDINKKQEVV